jgi:cyclic pyranopterin phosphate synthase
MFINTFTSNLQKVRDRRFPPPNLAIDKPGRLSPKPMARMPRLTHFDSTGASRMVDVGAKPATRRRARARGLLTMSAAALRAVRERAIGKGDVFEVSRLAGIMAAKKTSELIPLCHLLPLDSVAVDFEILDEHTVRVESAVSVHARTGAEMEALVAVSVALLTAYDMCKSIDKGIILGPIELVEKSGGKSGHFVRKS